jgi:hypothetical protein
MKTLLIVPLVLLVQPISALFGLGGPPPPPPDNSKHGGHCQQVMYFSGNPPWTTRDHKSKKNRKGDREYDDPSQTRHYKGKLNQLLHIHAPKGRHYRSASDNDQDFLNYFYSDSNE